MHGTAVPTAMTTQFFDRGTPQAQSLLALFRATAPPPTDRTHGLA
jgi:hypothetical protein